MPTDAPWAEATLQRLRAADRSFREAYAGEATARQPVHTLYVSADAFGPTAIEDALVAARRAFARHGATPGEFARALGMAGWEHAPGLDRDGLDAEAIARGDHDVPPHVWLAHQVHARVRRRLEGAAIADVRIDFEDGYGARPDLEEDADAIRCAQAVASLAEAGELCPRIGLRIEPLDDPNMDRAVRTLEFFVDALVEATGGALPAELVVTVPKVSHVAQARAADELLAALERRHGLSADRLRLEIMVETTQALLGPDGRCPLPEILRAAGTRMLGLHLGVYDFTAACQLSPLAQAPDHPLCDWARAMMRFAVGGTGVAVSDGATNVLPVAPPGVDPHAEPATAGEREAVHRGWRASYRHVRHALDQGVVQGWDLHGAQLPARYAAVFAHYVAGFDAAAIRLRAILADLSAAQTQSDALDDAATAQALLAFVLRAHDVGAIDADELRLAGLRVGETHHRTFAALSRHRRTAGRTP